MSGTKIGKIVLILPVILAGAVTLSSGGETDWNSALSRRLFGDAADGRLDQFSLLEAGLIAGGAATSDEVAQGVKEFERKFQPLTEKIQRQRSGKDRVHAVFECLHQQFLRGDYRAEYSELHRTLADGHFNCVTATLLFRYLCERSDLKSEVVASTGHVLCRIPGVSNQFIETTCPECHGPTGQSPGSIPAADQEHAFRVISDVELVGKVYYNRGVAALEAKQFSNAADLLTFARHFDRKDHATRDNLLATLNNWSLAACDAGDFELASDLIARGFGIDRSYPPLQANDLHIHQQWIKSLCHQQRFDRAMDVLEAVLRRHPKQQAFVEGRLAIYGRWAESLFVKENFSHGWTKFDEAKTQSKSWDVAQSKLAETEMSTVAAAAEKLIQSGRSVQARRLIEQASARSPQDVDLLQRKLHLPSASL